MIDTEIVAEIERLLDEDKLSQRKIAQLLGVSRGSVDAIAAGKRFDREMFVEEEVDEPIGPLERCPDCGGLVVMPCRACHERTRMVRRSAGSSPVQPVDCSASRESRGALFEANGRIPLALRPGHRARYEAVRRWRMSHPDQPMVGRSAS